MYVCVCVCLCVLFRMKKGAVNFLLNDSGHNFFFASHRISWITIRANYHEYTLEGTVSTPPTITPRSAACFGSDVLGPTLKSYCFILLFNPSCPFARSFGMWAANSWP